jgi:3-oxoadipate enol-lactonase
MAAGDTRCTHCRNRKPRFPACKSSSLTAPVTDAPAIRKCILWGHSDGAVIASQIGLLAPQPGELILEGLILEALHYYRVKPHSMEFFTSLAANPDLLGPRVIGILARDHGEPEWRDAVRGDCQAWVEIARAAENGRPDLYDGRMSEIRAPVALVHGRQDPRTEPGELEQVQKELPSAQVHVIAEGEHSPHSERAAQEECTRMIRNIVAGWRK